MWYVFFYIFIDIVFLSKAGNQQFCRFQFTILQPALTFRFNNDKQKQHKLTQIKVLAACYYTM